jgi:hypothetical protein
MARWQRGRVRVAAVLVAVVIQPDVLGGTRRRAVDVYSARLSDDFTRLQFRLRCSDGALIEVTIADINALLSGGRQLEGGFHDE